MFDLDSVRTSTALFAVALLTWLSSAGGAFGAQRARAQEVVVSSPAPAPSAPTRFSLGVGLGFAGYGDSGLGALGGLGASSLVAAQPRTPYGTALVEIEASPLWRFVVGVAGSYDKLMSAEGLGTNGSPASGGFGPAHSWTFGGSLGVRRVLNPGSVVEVSPILTFGGHRAEVEGVRTSSASSADGSIVYGTRDTTSKGVDGRLGLVLEYALLPKLLLRFETYVLRVGYSKTASADNTPGAPASSAKREDLSVGYGLSPALQLRLKF